MSSGDMELKTMQGERVGGVFAGEGTQMTSLTLRKTPISSQ